MRPSIVWIVVGIAAILCTLMAADMWHIVEYGEALFPTFISIIK